MRGRTDRGNDELSSVGRRRTLVKLVAQQIFASIADWRRQLISEIEAPAAIRELLTSVQLSEKGLHVALTLPLRSHGKESTAAPASLPLCHFISMKMRRRGVEMRIVLEGQAQASRQVEATLLKAIARAKCWFEQLASGNAASLLEIARRERLLKRYVARLIRLAFILPAVVEAIASGSAALGINLQMLMDGRCSLPLNWQDQQAML